MVLGGYPPGRVGRRRNFLARNPPPRPGVPARLRCAPGVGGPLDALREAPGSMPRCPKLPVLPAPLNRAAGRQPATVAGARRASYAKGGTGTSRPGPVQAGGRAALRWLEARRTVVTVGPGRWRGTAGIPHPAAGPPVGAIPWTPAGAPHGPRPVAPRLGMSRGIDQRPGAAPQPGGTRQPGPGADPARDRPPPVVRVGTRVAAGPGSAVRRPHRGGTDGQRVAIRERAPTGGAHKGPTGVVLPASGAVAPASQAVRAAPAAAARECRPPPVRPPPAAVEGGRA